MVGTIEDDAESFRREVDAAERFRVANRAVIAKIREGSPVVQVPVGELERLAERVTVIEQELAFARDALSQLSAFLLNRFNGRGGRGT